VLFTEISPGDQVRIDYLAEPPARPSDD
jgi:hypothetical protein